MSYADLRASPRAVRRLVTILRLEAAAGVSVALLHIADASSRRGTPARWPAHIGRSMAAAGNQGLRGGVRFPALSYEDAEALVRAITSRSWWRLATPSLG
jgi:hypothetical protein